MCLKIINICIHIYLFILYKYVLHIVLVLILGVFRVILSDHYQVDDASLTLLCNCF